jgi:predicted exporter
MVRAAEHIVVPLTGSEHALIGSVAALGADFAQGVAQVDAINLIVLAAAQSYTAIHVVSQPTGFFAGAWRLCRHGNCQQTGNESKQKSLFHSLGIFNE